MINTNIDNFQKDITAFLESTIKYDEPVNICTEDGNAVVISESLYRNLIETLYLSSQPEMKEKIIDGIKTDLSECVPENEVKW